MPGITAFTGYSSDTIPENQGLKNTNQPEKNQWSERGKSVKFPERQKTFDSREICWRRSTDLTNDRGGQ